MKQKSCLQANLKKSRRKNPKPFISNGIISILCRDILITETTEEKEHNEETVANQGSSGQIDLEERIELNSEATTEIHTENNTPLQDLIIQFEGRLVKIPRKQDLQILDPISIYEYKISGILMLQQILPRFHDGLTKEKTREKDIKRHEETFLEIEPDLITEVFRQR